METPEGRKDGMGGRQADKRRDVRREKRATRAWIGKVSQTVNSRVVQCVQLVV